MVMKVHVRILLMAAHIQIFCMSGPLIMMKIRSDPTQQGMNDCEIFGDENTGSDGGEEDEEYTDDSADSNEVG